MEKVLDLDASVHSLCEKYPELKQILHDIGFTDIVKPGMLSTAGRFMTLTKGAAMKNIPLAVIFDKLREHGFTTIERKANL